MQQYCEYVQLSACRRLDTPNSKRFCVESRPFQTPRFPTPPPTTTMRDTQEPFHVTLLPYARARPECIFGGANAAYDSHSGTRCATRSYITHNAHVQMFSACGYNSICCSGRWFLSEKPLRVHDGGRTVCRSDGFYAGDKSAFVNIRVHKNVSERWPVATPVARKSYSGTRARELSPQRIFVDRFPPVRCAQTTL